MDYVNGGAKRRRSYSKKRSTTKRRRSYTPKPKRRRSYSKSKPKRRSSYSPKRRYNRRSRDDYYSSSSSSDYDDNDIVLSREVNYYTLVDEFGNPLGGRYSGISPQQAIRKLRDQWWNGRNNTRVFVRQTSPGPTHGRVYVFNVKRKQVPAPLYMRNLTGYNTMWQKTPSLFHTFSSDDVASAMARQQSLLDYIKKLTQHDKHKM